VHLTLDDAEKIACDVLHARLALNVHPHVDARLSIAHPLECDDAVVFDLAVDRLPSDLFVRLLLSDLRRSTDGFSPRISRSWPGLSARAQTEECRA
jgi:hypothetical protein